MIIQQKKSSTDNKVLLPPTNPVSGLQEKDVLTVNQSDYLEPVYASFINLNPTIFFADNKTKYIDDV